MADDGADVGHVLTARDVAGAALRVAEPELVGGVLHWVASAPDGTGGSVLVAASPGGTMRTVSPPGVSIRSRLYGYGADAWCATDLGLVGIDAATQQLCRFTADGATPLGTAPSPGETLGDPVAVPGSPFVVVVAERRTREAPTRGLEVVHLETGASAWLLEVEGWCAEPAVSADGRRLAWLRWPARTMPWDAAELWVGRSSPRARPSCAGRRGESTVAPAPRSASRPGDGTARSPTSRRLPGTGRPGCATRVA